MWRNLMHASARRSASSSSSHSTGRRWMHGGAPNAASSGLYAIRSPATSAAAAAAAPTANVAPASRLLHPLGLQSVIRPAAAVASRAFHTLSSGLLVPSSLAPPSGSSSSSILAAANSAGSPSGLHHSSKARSTAVGNDSTTLPRDDRDDSAAAASASTPAATPSPSRVITSAGSGLITPQSPGLFVAGASAADAVAQEENERDPRMLDCILIRHGESEGNIAYNRSWEGDHSLYTGAFLKRHSSLWRLTDRGREQARITGEWLRAHTRSDKDLDPAVAHLQTTIYRYYVSEYIRAMETAALMELPESKWFVEVQLRERDWGTFDIMSQKERVVRFSEETRRRDRDSLFYAPPGGESLVHVLSRVDGVLTNFNRQCANRRCIVVCHGEVMWAFRLRFERLSQLTYREMEAASNPHERIHNCQILWYSRRNPFTGEVSRFFKWKRSVCPWDPSRATDRWEQIHRVEHTNDSLKQHVNRVKRIYGDEKSHRATTAHAETAAAQARQTSARPSVLSPTAALLSDPNIAREIQSLKTDLPVMAAAAAASPHDDLSLQLPAAPTPEDLNLNLDPSSEDAHLPLAFVPAEGVVLGLGHSKAKAAQAVRLTSSSPAGSTHHAAHPAAAAAASPTVRTIPAPIPSYKHAPGWPFLSAHPRVLVLTKTPRYEHEKNSTGLKGEDLHAELSKLGFVSDRLVQSYVRHMEGLSQLIAALQQHSMKVVVKHVDSATHADLEGIDLILSAGGDGTMLKAAALLGYHQSTGASALQLQQITAAASVPAPASAQSPSSPSSSSTLAAADLHTDNSTDDHHLHGAPFPPPPPPPVVANGASASTTSSSDPSSAGLGASSFVPLPLIGVNTDPQHSSGVLCAFSIEGPHTAERVIDHLRRSHFVWVEKSRIEITLIDKTGVATHVGQYAYNDVVVAERDPGRPIVYELTVDDHAAEIQRSSGVLVCTGTGSTAWMANAAGIHPDQVAAVLKDVGLKKSVADCQHIAERINQDLVFEQNSPEVQYFVREPLLPLSSSAMTRGSYQHRHGWATRIAVRSLGWDAVMSIDGINLVQLPKGTTAVLNIGRKPGANLTVLSLAGTGGEPFSRQ